MCVYIIIDIKLINVIYKEITTNNYEKIFRIAIIGNGIIGTMI